MMTKEIKPNVTDHLSPADQAMMKVVDSEPVSDQELDQEVEAMAAAEIPRTDATGKERIKENITTIRKAIGDGRHSTVFNPGSWKDILRALSAYDADHLIIAETATQRQGEAQRQLDLLGIKYEVKISEDQKTRVISFDLEGRPRTITERYEDARIVAKEIGHVDVFHRYNPTGADTPLNTLQLYAWEKYGVQNSYEALGYAQDPDAPKPNSYTGEYEIAVPGIKGSLTPELYDQVNEGGFFVFNESRLHVAHSVGVSENTPASLYALMGIEEKQITARHPATVVTSGHDGTKKVGYIYQKVKSVEWPIMEAAEEAIDFSDKIKDGFSSLKEGGFDFLGINIDMSKEQIEAAVHDRYSQLQKLVGTIANSFKSAGSDVGLVDAYKRETMEQFTEKLLAFQGTVKKLIQEYDTVADQISAAQISLEDGLQRLGIIVEEGQPKDTIYPFASVLVYNDEESSDKAYSFLTQLTQADLKSELELE